MMDSLSPAEMHQRSLQIAGSTVDVPQGLERVRLSVGKVSRMAITINEQPCYVAIINKSRLERGLVEYGPLGGGAEFAQGLPQKQALKERFGFTDAQFDPKAPMDIRISNIPLGEIETVTQAILLEDYLDLPGNLIDEFRQELQGEMEEVSSLSGGGFQVENYSGPLPARTDMRITDRQVPPIQSSGRTGEPSLRIIMVMDVAAPEELQTYIRSHATVLSKDTTVIETPFLCIPQKDIPYWQTMIRQSPKESLTLPHVTFADQDKRDVSLSGLVCML